MESLHRATDQSNGHLIRDLSNSRSNSPAIMDASCDSQRVMTNHCFVTGNKSVVNGQRSNQRKATARSNLYWLVACTGGAPNFGEAQSKIDCKIGAPEQLTFNTNRQSNEKPVIVFRRKTGYFAISDNALLRNH